MRNFLFFSEDKELLKKALLREMFLVKVTQLTIVPLATFICFLEVHNIIIFSIIIKDYFYNIFIHYLKSIYTIYQFFFVFFPYSPSFSMYSSFFKSIKMLNFLKHEMLKNALRMI